jgi:hypothetical protein
MTKMTSTEPINTCSVTAVIERSMNFALSSTTVSLTPGTSRFTRSTSRRTCSAICTVLVPDCFCTIMRTAGRPLMRMTERTSSVASFTSAMSFM